ncbi:YidC/Oxa1 family membrane protein insertase [Staphylospora marina]|uniref:YidC/Oxa1 family membrane protein insertase n=1 Tax=Staphylospora marina TaxID=2490858 RepID=UPI000F5B9F8B|nr:YidC/Oxa1 family membrane protein insertase [Staphylospora marina]
MAVVLLSGCAPTDVKYEIDPENAGWWDKLLVLPLSGLLDGFKNILGNFGLSILVVTFLVRLAVFPLTWKQQKSAEAMKQIQPQMVKIREKYKNNPQKMQEETMKLFQKEGVNPMAGCLPMLVQLPILFAFYQAIMYNPHIRTSEFLWLELGKADPYFILPILAAVTTYIQLIATGSADNPQMKVMLWVMPVMIFVLAYQFPAALSLYWVYSNIFTILQYLIFFRKKKDKLAEGAAR